MYAFLICSSVMGWPGWPSPRALLRRHRRALLLHLLLRRRLLLRRHPGEVRDALAPGPPITCCWPPGPLTRTPAAALLAAIACCCFIIIICCFCCCAAPPSSAPQSSSSPYPLPAGVSLHRLHLHACCCCIIIICCCCCGGAPIRPGAPPNPPWPRRPITGAPLVITFPPIIIPGPPGPPASSPGVHLHRPAWTGAGTHSLGGICIEPPGGAMPPPHARPVGRAGGRRRPAGTRLGARHHDARHSLQSRSSVASLQYSSCHRDGGWVGMGAVVRE